MNCWGTGDRSRSRTPSAADQPTKRTGTATVFELDRSKNIGRHIPITVKGKLEATLPKFGMREKGMIGLGAVDGDANSAASSINSTNKGQIAGGWAAGMCHFRPTRFSAGERTNGRVKHAGSSLPYNSHVRRGAEPGFSFENCLRTMLSKASTAGLSRLGFNPMSIDVQCRERTFL